jgi:hypothetical protein
VESGNLNDEDTKRRLQSIAQKIGALIGDAPGVNDPNLSNSGQVSLRMYDIFLQDVTTTLELS